MARDRADTRRLRAVLQTARCLFVDAGDRQNQAREILIAHDGLEFDLPD